jgi:hypothetical protein
LLAVDPGYSFTFHETAENLKVEGYVIRKKSREDGMSREDEMRRKKGQDFVPANDVVLNNNVLI